MCYNPQSLRFVSHRQLPEILHAKIFVCVAQWFTPHAQSLATLAADVAAIRGDLNSLTTKVDRLSDNVAKGTIIMARVCPYNFAMTFHLIILSTIIVES